MFSKRFLGAACAAMFAVGGLGAIEAEAANRYGVTGLGSNLHRRFVLKQAVKRADRGQRVSNRAIVWYARPSLARSGSSYRYRGR
ncbi:MAG: hypothetical protein AAGJ46_10015 [Planctomycetota bacterium]